MEIGPEQSVATCAYCGTRQTLPKLDNHDDRKGNLYDRANHFRRNHDFDKAMAIYEQILNEDKTDAESYWSILLCRYGIEYVEDAIADARVNAELNGFDNLLFFAGDMKDILTRDFIAGHGRPDVIITDPPRAGMHADVVDTILFAAPRRIVYVSCNPATQARDLQLLDVDYKVTAVQPVDMFPHTHHVENVVLLERRIDK